MILYVHTLFYLSRVSQVCQDKRWALFCISLLKKIMVSNLKKYFTIALELQCTFYCISTHCPLSNWWIFHLEQKAISSNILLPPVLVDFYVLCYFKYLQGLMQKRNKVVFYLLLLCFGWNLYAVNWYFRKKVHIRQRIIVGLLEWLRKRWFQQIIYPFACVVSTHHLFAVNFLWISVNIRLSVSPQGDQGDVGPPGPEGPKVFHFLPVL